MHGSTFTFVLSIWLFTYNVAASCPAALLPRFEYKIQKHFKCAVKGFVQDPVVVQTLKNLTVVADCGQACLDNARCKSFRFSDNTHNSQAKCYLYGKSLSRMHVMYDNYRRGELYERDCFTSDCNVIAACANAKKCFKSEEGNGDRCGFIDFSIYACDYGKTIDPQQLGSYETYLYAGNLTACEAIVSCRDETSYARFDVHYHKPSDQWECIVFDGVTADPEPFEDPTEYSFTNKTVGAGYAYLISDFYYDYGDNGCYYK